MTAPDARARLVKALTEAQEASHTTIPVPDGLYPHEIDAVADALLPVVDALADERAAEALEVFADKWGRWVMENAPQIRGGASYRARVEATLLRAASSDRGQA